VAASNLNERKSKDTHAGKEDDKRIIYIDIFVDLLIGVGFLGMGVILHIL